jgi:two-component system, LuxR family, response regulator DctR
MNTRTPVYLCDDDEGVREALGFLLRQHEFDVRAHASGPALLGALAAAEQPARGVLLLDVRMEPLGGPQLQLELIARGLGKRNPIIFLSAHGDIPLAVEALARGAYSFVEKPYADHALVALIAQACALEAEWYVRAQRCDFLAAQLAGLTRQQRRLMPLVAAGELNKVIADTLGLAVRSVEVHRAKLFESLGVGSAAELATLVAEMRGAGLEIGGQVREVEQKPTRT